MIFLDVLSDRCLRICSSLLSVSRLVGKVCLGREDKWGGVDGGMSASIVNNLSVLDVLVEEGSRSDSL